MSFDEALLLLQIGKKVRREGWSDLALGDGSRRGEMWLEVRREGMDVYVVLLIGHELQTRQHPVRWTGTLTDRAAADWEEKLA